MPRIQNKAAERLGETRLMNCGLKCTIIEYKDCNHITVEFETGEIVPRRIYSDFTKGKLHPRQRSNPGNWRRQYYMPPIPRKKRGRPL